MGGEYAQNTPEAHGAGLCILPTFIGDVDTRLIKLSSNINGLASARWLVSHDDRNVKAIRHVADELAKLFRAMSD